MIFKHYGSCENCDHMLCCKLFPCVVEYSELNRIAKYTKMNRTEFVQKYLFDISTKQPNGTVQIRYIMNNVPCPFLKSSGCSIYPVRPRVCNYFPFQPGLQIVLEGIEICPTATLIASECFEFIMNQRKKYGLTDEDIVQMQTKLKPQNHLKEQYKKAYLGPMEVRYKEMGIENIVNQGFQDTYDFETIKTIIKLKKVK